MVAQLLKQRDDNINAERTRQREDAATRSSSTDSPIAEPSRNAPTGDFLWMMPAGPPQLVQAPPRAQPPRLLRADSPARALPPVSAGPPPAAPPLVQADTAVGVDAALRSALIPSWFRGRKKDSMTMSEPVISE